ncbi:hypothetical protein A5634_11950 [Mycobacterium asiaticum]|uniref:PucR family transcriptional regulator n=1 Tax=Mycobacterium asiaticum TaxID=1790 RepID=A0A1A3NHV5_MYCAS|nr:helix-turn-helix domain-containing protein [Mycobacterium asiaticum]OBK20900.1 hypothetical protein A5634_11950 [Mycobacterium asiaticum]
MSETGGGQLSVIARQMDAIRDEFIGELFEVMKKEIPVPSYDSRMMALWRASLTENVVAGIHYIERDPPEPFLEAPAAALAYVRAAAQRDTPLSALVRAHRIGHARFLQRAMQFVALLESSERVPAIVELVNRCARFVDVVGDQLTVAYEQEHDRWLSRRSGLQQQWVSDILAGTPVDVQRAEMVLGYQLDVAHIAAVWWADTTVPTRDVAALLDKAGSLIAGELRAAGRALMVPTDEREARLWFSPIPAREAVAAERARVRAAFESAGIPACLAFGRVERGLDGFRASLKQAERAKAVALGAGRHPRDRVVYYADVAPIALMATDAEELGRFVTEALGDLAVDDERNQWLRETLREFLARNRSYVATAEAMILHRNTIQYRVAQAMERCGQDFDDPDAVFRVQTALEVCRWMAPAVLRTANPSV